MRKRKQIASTKLNRLRKLTTLPYNQFAKVNMLAGKVEYGNATKNDVDYLRGVYNKHFQRESKLDRLRSLRTSIKGHLKRTEDLFNALNTKDIHFELRNDSLNNFGKELVNKDNWARYKRMNGRELNTAIKQAEQFRERINSTQKRFQLASESLVQTYIESLKYKGKERDMKRITLLQTKQTFIREYSNRNGVSMETATKEFYFQVDNMLDSLYTQGEITPQEYRELGAEIRFNKD